MKTNPYKAVSFKQSAIEACLEQGAGLIADCKYDGVRLNLIVADNGTLVLSRVAKTIPALEHLNGFSERWAAFLADDRQPFNAGLMIDGEVMVKGVDFNTGSGLLRTCHLKDTNYQFDVSGLKGFDKKLNKEKMPFGIAPQHLKVVVYGAIPLDIVESGADYERMNVLMQSDCCVQVALLEEHFPEIEWTIAESHDVFSMDELNVLYDGVREAGHEGLVVKDPMGFYRRGKKTGWWKMKPEDEEDGIVQGLIWGTPGKANEGKVIGFQCLLENGVNVDVTNITQAQMEEFTATVRDYPEHEEFFNGFQVQIKYMEKTPDGSLRHPAFVCFRGTEENPSEKI